MAKHRAPEPTPAVVRMASVRQARARAGRLGIQPAGVVAVGGADQGDGVGRADGPGCFLDDLTLIAADDRLLDCIAAGRGDVFIMPKRISAGFPAGSLAPLLATWRSEIVDPQWPALPSHDQVQQAVRGVRPPAAKQVRRALRPVLGVAIAISALLFGSAAVGAQSAKPGDVLWPLSRVLYADRAGSLEADQAARVQLGVAETALSSNNPDKALDALTVASGDMQSVRIPDVKATLQDDYNQLMVKASSASASAVASSAKDSASESAGSASSAGSGRAAAAVGTPLASVPRKSTPPTSATSTGRPSGSGSGSRSAPTRTSAPAGTTTPVFPPPVTVPTSPVVSATSTLWSTTAPPATPTPTVAASSNPVTTGPVTTGPGTTTSDQPTPTDQSTTSQLPTPTPTPTASASNTDAGDAAAIGPVAGASP